MVCVARWEDEQALKQTFLAALAWGQDGYHGGRNVMTLRKDATSQDQEGEQALLAQQVLPRPRMGDTLVIEPYGIDEQENLN